MFLASGCFLSGSWSRALGVQGVVPSADRFAGAGAAVPLHPQGHQPRSLRSGPRLLGGALSGGGPLLLCCDVGFRLLTEPGTSLGSGDWVCGSARRWASARSVLCGFV